MAGLDYNRRLDSAVSSLLGTPPPPIEEEEEKQQTPSPLDLAVEKVYSELISPAQQPVAAPPFPEPTTPTQSRFSGFGGRGFQPDETAAPLETPTFPPVSEQAIEQVAEGIAQQPEGGLVVSERVPPEFHSQIGEVLEGKYGQEALTMLRAADKHHQSLYGEPLYSQPEPEKEFQLRDIPAGGLPTEQDIIAGGKRAERLGKDAVSRVARFLPTDEMAAVPPPVSTPAMSAHAEDVPEQIGPLAARDKVGTPSDILTGIPEERQPEIPPPKRTPQKSSIPELRQAPPDTLSDRISRALLGEDIEQPPPTTGIPRLDELAKESGDTVSTGDLALLGITALGTMSTLGVINPGTFTLMEAIPALPAKAASIAKIAKKVRQVIPHFLSLSLAEITGGIVAATIAGKIGGKVLSAFGETLTGEKGKIRGEKIGDLLASLVAFPSGVKAARAVRGRMFPIKGVPSAESPPLFEEFFPPDMLPPEQAAKVLKKKFGLGDSATIEDVGLAYRRAVGARLKVIQESGDPNPVETLKGELGKGIHDWHSLYNSVKNHPDLFALKPGEPFKGERPMREPAQPAPPKASAPQKPPPRTPKEETPAPTPQETTPEPGFTMGKPSPATQESGFKMGPTPEATPEPEFTMGKPEPEVEQGPQPEAKTPTEQAEPTQQVQPPIPTEKTATQAPQETQPPTSQAAPAKIQPTEPPVKTPAPARLQPGKQQTVEEVEQETPKRREIYNRAIQDIADRLKPYWVGSDEQNRRIEFDAQYREVVGSIPAQYQYEGKIDPVATNVHRNLALPESKEIVWRRIQDILTPSEPTPLPPPPPPAPKQQQAQPTASRPGPPPADVVPPPPPPTPGVTAKDIGGVTPEAEAQPKPAETVPLPPAPPSTPAQQTAEEAEVTPPAPETSPQASQPPQLQPGPPNRMLEIQSRYKLTPEQAAVVNTALANLPSGFTTTAEALQKTILKIAIPQQTIDVSSIGDVKFAKKVLADYPDIGKQPLATPPPTPEQEAAETPAPQPTPAQQAAEAAEPSTTPPIQAAEYQPIEKEVPDTEVTEEGIEKETEEVAAPTEEEVQEKIELARKIQPLQKVRITPSQAYAGNRLKEGSLVSDGHVLFITDNMGSRPTKILKPNAQPGTIEQASAQKTVDDAIKRAQTEVEVLGTAEKTPIPATYLVNEGEGLQVTVNHSKLKNALAITKADTIKASNKAGPVVLFKNDKPVAIVMPMRGRDIDISEARQTLKKMVPEEDPAEVRETGIPYDESELLKEPAPIFYSALRRVIERDMPSRAAPPQVKALLKKPGVKQDEVNWTGIEEWLDKQTRSLNKQDVLDFLTQNEVQIEEVRKGAGTIDEDSLSSDIASADRAKFAPFTLPGGAEVDKTYQELLLTLPREETFNRQIEDRLIEGLRKAGADDRTIDYLEKNWGTPAARELARQLAPDVVEQYEKDFDRYISSPYKSPHFEELNILAHVRFNERTDADGQRVLFLEEIQSDWHSEGRKKGYRQGSLDINELLRQGDKIDATLGRLLRGIDDDIATLIRNIGAKKEAVFTESDRVQRNSLAQLQKLSDAGRINNPMSPVLEGLSDNIKKEYGDRVRAFDENLNRLNSIREQLDEATKGGGVPPAPFAKNWHELVLKRMLRWAAENGFDRMAWTTGQQQADRYDLSKQVTAIEAFPSDTTEGNFDLQISLEDGQTLSATTDKRLSDIPPDKLSDVVGKDLAGKIVAKEGAEITGSMLPPGQERGRRYTGADLKVGGEWAKNLYDRMIPQFLSKYGKKWGVKVGETEIKVGESRNYAGPEYTLEQLRPVYRESQKTGDNRISPLTGKTLVFPFTRVAISQPLGKIINHMARGLSFRDAIDMEINGQLAELFGGSLEGTPDYKSVPAINITPEMKQSVLEEGQALFEKETPYAEPKTRQEAVEQGKTALADIGEPQPDLSTTGGKLSRAGAGVRTVALGIKTSLEKTGWTDLRGQKAETAEDIAVLAQVFRDKRFETFRVFYVQDGKIAAHEGFTSRIPDTVQVFSTGKRQQQIHQMQQRVKRIQAANPDAGPVTTYILHNHPGGNPSPSSQDIAMTEYFAKRMPKFQGQVVINFNEYFFIAHDTATGKVEGALHSLPEPTLGDDPLTRPEIPHDLLTTVINNDTDLAIVGKKLQTPNQFVTLLYRGTNGTVRAIQEMPVALFARPKEAADFIRGNAKKFGAPQVLAYYGNNLESVNKASRELIKTGTLLDAVVGANEGLPGVGAEVVAEPGMRFGRPFSPSRYRVAEEGKPPDRTDLEQFSLFEETPLEPTEGQPPLKESQEIEETAPEEIQPTEPTEEEVKGPDYETYGPIGGDPDALSFPDSNPASTPEQKARFVHRKDLIDTLGRIVSAPVRTGKMYGIKSSVRGILKKQPPVIRTRLWGDINAVSHEVGHFFDKYVLDDEGRKAFYDRHNPALMKLAENLEKPSESEGFAELIRLLITNRNEAVAQAPEAVKEVEEHLRLNEPDILGAIGEFAAKYNAWHSMRLADRAESMIMRDPVDTRPTGKEFVRRVYYGTINDLNPIAEGHNAMAAGEVLPPEQNAYILARTSRGWIPKVAEMFLFDGTVDFETRRITGPGLSKVLDPVNEEWRRFENYAILRRLQELLGRAQTVTEGKKDRRAINQIRAMSMALEIPMRRNKEGVYEMVELDEEVRALEGEHPNFQDTFQQFQKWNDSFLKYLRDAEVLSPKGYERIKELNKSYFPFHRLLSEEGSYHGKGKAAFANLPKIPKGQKGSSRLFLDPLESAVRNVYSFLSIAERNQVGLQLANLADKSGKRAADWMERIDHPVELHAFELENIRKSLVEAGIDPEVLDEADLQTTALIFSKDKFARSPGELIFFRKGEPIRYHIPDPLLYESLTLGLDRGDADFITTILNEIPEGALRTLVEVGLVGPARWLRRGATLSLEFMARNPTRDIINLILLQEGSAKGLIKDIPKAYIEFTKGMLSVYKADEHYEAYMRGGGGISAMSSLDRQYIEQTLEKVLKGDKSTLTIKDPLSYMQAVSLLFELANRVATSRRKRERLGVTRAPLETATKGQLLLGGMAGREDVVDFNMRGAWKAIKTASRLASFWKAGILGWDAFFRAIKRNPKRVAAFGGYMAGFSVLLWWLQHDDDRYRDQDQQLKDGSWIIFPDIIAKKLGILFPDNLASALGLEGEWFNPHFRITIPKPWAPGIIFGSVPERILDYLTGEGWDVMDTVRMLVADTFLPVPTTLYPFLENFANYSLHFQRPVVPMGEERMLPEYRYGPGTPHWIKSLQRLTGISDPRRIENVIYRYTGGTGRFASEIIDSLYKNTLRAFGAKIPRRPSRGLADWPLLRAFFASRPTLNSKPIRDFYKEYKNLSEVYNSFEAAESEGKEEGRKFYDKNYEDMALYVYFEEVARDLSYRRESMRAIEQRTDLTSKEMADMVEPDVLDTIRQSREAMELLRRRRTESEKTSRLRKSRKGEKPPIIKTWGMAVPPPVERARPLRRQMGVPPPVEEARP